MKEILNQIQTGAFANEWILEGQAGLPVKKSLERMESEHLVEAGGSTAPGHDALAAEEVNLYSQISYNSDLR